MRISQLPDQATVLLRVVKPWTSNDFNQFCDVSAMKAKRGLPRPSTSSCATTSHNQNARHSGYVIVVEGYPNRFVRSLKRQPNHPGTHAVLSLPIRLQTTGPDSRHERDFPVEPRTARSVHPQDHTSRECLLPRVKSAPWIHGGGYSHEFDCHEIQLISVLYWLGGWPARHKE